MPFLGDGTFIGHHKITAMQRPDAKSIEEATERVKQRFPIGDIRKMENYQEITPEEYEKLIKDAETFALLILESYALNGKQ